MQLVKINGKVGVMFEFGVDVKTEIVNIPEFLKVVPAGVLSKFPHAYMLRHGESDWTEPVTVERFVYVDRLGFVLFAEPIVFMDSDEYMEVKSFERLEE